MKAQERRKAIEVTLHPDTIEQARAIGGTVSRGAEMAITEYWRRLAQSLPVGVHMPNCICVKCENKRKRRPSNQSEQQK